MTTETANPLMSEVEFSERHLVQLGRREQVVREFYKAAHEFAAHVANYITQNYDVMMRVNFGWGSVGEERFCKWYSDTRRPLERLRLDINLAEARTGFSFRRKRRWIVRVSGEQEIIKFGDDERTAMDIKNSGSICDGGFHIAQGEFKTSFNGGSLFSIVCRNSYPGYEPFPVDALFEEMKKQIDQHHDFIPVKRVANLAFAPA